jgi:hypothetical protein
MHRFGGMDLMNGRKLGLRKQRGDGEATVAGDRFAVVPTAIADIETGKIARRDSAAAAQESMWQAPQRNGPDNFDVAHSAFRMMMSSSA